MRENQFHFIENNRAQAANLQAYLPLTLGKRHVIIHPVFTLMGVIRFRRDTWRSDRASRMSVGLVNHPAKP